MHVHEAWHATGRFAAALMLGAATRMALPGREGPRAGHARDIYLYHVREPNVFVDYAVGYPSLRALESAADLIITGRLTESRESGQHSTILTIEVGHAFKGDASDEITIYYPAGADDVLSGDPAFQHDMTYLLFLERAPDGLTYSVLEGPAGRFVVDGARFSALSVVYGDNHILDTGLAGIPVGRVGWDLGQPATRPGQLAVMPDVRNMRHTDQSPSAPPRNP